MSKNKTLLMLILMAFSSLSAFGQNNEDRELTNAVEKLRVALLDADRNALNDIAAEKLNYWHSSGKHENKTAFIESLVSGQSDFVSLEFKEQTITLSGDVGVVHHILSGKTNDGGKPGFVKIGVTLIFQKQDNEWKLLARQAFKLPSATN